MTDKLLIERELLERAVKADASNGASSVDLVDGWKAMEQIRAILAAPRQPEGETFMGEPVIHPGVEVSRESLQALFLASGCSGAVENSEVVEQGVRAIAELRELIGAAQRVTCAVIDERDTLRQQLAEMQEVNRIQLEIATVHGAACVEIRKQRDKLAGLLREWRGMFDGGLASGQLGVLRGQTDAALAEVNK